MFAVSQSQSSERSKEEGAQVRWTQNKAFQSTCENALLSTHLPFGIFSPIVEQ